MEKLLNFTNRKFQALDILRLWAAFEIALFHAQFSGFYHANGYIFADFFFILSGFILAETHFSDPNMDSGQFIKTRFLRLYPLHFLATIAVLIHFLFIRRGIYDFADGAIYTFFSNIFMTHGLGFRKLSDGDWNFPSWAVASEFWANAFFAIFLFKLRKGIIGFIAIFGYLSLFTKDSTTDTFFNNSLVIVNSGMVRAISGICFGVIVHEVMKKNREKSPWVWSIAEFSSLSAVLLLLVPFGQKHLKLNDFLIVPLFGILVAVYSVQAGIISKTVIKLRLHLLGPLAYAIYLFHYPAIMFIHDVLFPKAENRLFIYIPLLLFGSGLIHFLIEKPLIDLHKKQGISQREVILGGSILCLFVGLFYLLNKT